MTTSRLRRIASRARLTWNEMDYVQRRLFEMQTGIELTGTRRPGVRDGSARLYRRDY